jgi:hypothetical protein
MTVCIGHPFYNVSGLTWRTGPIHQSLESGDGIQVGMYQFFDRQEQSYLFAVPTEDLCIDSGRR